MRFGQFFCTTSSPTFSSSSQRSVGAFASAVLCTSAHEMPPISHDFFPAPNLPACSELAGSKREANVPASIRASVSSAHQKSVSSSSACIAAVAEMYPSV